MGCPQRQCVVQEKALGLISETQLLLRWVECSDFSSGGLPEFCNAEISIAADTWSISHPFITS